MGRVPGSVTTMGYWIRELEDTDQEKPLRYDEFGTREEVFARVREVLDNGHRATVGELGDG